ncbi:hypothetical protein LTR36_002782 [Oleoguttula mirabilis]|uniref:UDENN domain-containing protein n=1 Tax=Oleoguttula mirabilis TaxID=1507867 RepID=A0AAV9JJ24_9PEZI|nr:hypothetical protein LTR36_002782 [Oleoguttula mirabilis]
MATVLPMRSNTNSTGTTTSTTSRNTRDHSSLSSFPSSSKRSTAQSTHNEHHTHTNSTPSSAHSYQSSLQLPTRQSTTGSSSNSHGRPTTSATATATATNRPRNVMTANHRSHNRTRPVKSQYPASSTEKHVEYILVASFDIDRGSVMEHQYPGPVGGDEHMLAELMLPDQTHLRSQDWTIFFLHKDGAAEEEGAEERRRQRRRRRSRRRKRELGGGGEEGQAEEGAEGGGEKDGGDGEHGDLDNDEEDGGVDEDDDDDASSDGTSSDEDEYNVDGPPLVYVLNLVNTKQDSTVKRGAVVKAMAVCTRHSFLHIYKPLLLLALEQYFANPVIDTLAELYEAVNSMDLSLMPRLNVFERFILQGCEAKDLFVEKFEAVIAQRMASSSGHNAITNPAAKDKDRDTTSSSHDIPPASATLPPLPTPSPTNPHNQHQHHLPTTPTPRTRYGLPRDTHEFDSLVHYAHIPIPIRVPVALSPETVGDFSLVKLITTFSTPHTTNPLPFSPVHPHLTTGGSTTHPIIVLLNALLTQKRVIFLGHNLPSSDVAEAVLGACALASGGMLRGFTRHAFPYTDLTKIDDLLKVPGFIAGVTNPAFAHKPEWWDLLCDLGTGRMRISGKIEVAGAGGEGVQFFSQSPQALAGNAHHAFAAHAGGGGGSGAGGGGGGIGGGGGSGGISAIAAAGASLSAGLGGSAGYAGMGLGGAGDATGDAAFMAHVLKAIEERAGENAIRGRFRKWVVRFTRLAAAFEEMVYGASALQIATTGAGGGGGGSPKAASSPLGGAAGGENPMAAESPAALAGGAAAANKMMHAVAEDDALPPEVTGHGYVWPTAQLKMQELAANATRIEGWRNTRSYYNIVQDLAAYWVHRPVKHVDLHHLHDMLAKLRLGHDVAANIYLAICAAAETEAEISQLLAVVVNGVWDVRRGGPAGQAGGGGVQGGLFYLALGLWHPRVEVREAVAGLLGRVREHEAGRHFWEGLGRFARRGWERVVAGREARVGGLVGGEEEGGG